MTFFVLSLLLTACSPSLPPVGAANLEAIRTTRPWATNSDLVEGRSLFASRCGSCHGLPSPSSHGADQWPGLVASMAKPAALDTADSRKVLDWILSARGL
jgi:cytochrome c5